jgi:hypothetical protein
MTITFCTIKKEIYINDIGVTMRTLLAVAARGMEECGNRKWHIVYKEARIGLVQVKNKNINEFKNPNVAFVENKTCDKKTKFAEAFERANLAITKESQAQ